MASERRVVADHERHAVPSHLVLQEVAVAAGVHVVAHGSERALLDPLPVRALWGIGPVAETALARAGVTTVAALAALELPEVTSMLGSAVGTGVSAGATGGATDTRKRVLACSSVKTIELLVAARETGSRPFSS